MAENTMKLEIEMPEKVEAKVEGRVVTVKGPQGENTREFRIPGLQIKTEGNKLTLEIGNVRKESKKNINTIRAHINNMAEGVLNGFKYTLKICSGHFPMNVSVSGKEFIVKNYLGEKVPRVLKLKEGATVKVEGAEVTVEGIDKEIVGQVAADIEQLTRITNRDIRIFQDGIYIIKKPGKDLV